MWADLLQMFDIPTPIFIGLIVLLVALIIAFLIIRKNANRDDDD